MEIIQFSPDAEGSKYNGKLATYLKEQDIVRTGGSDEFPEYRVASGLTREEAVVRLCNLAGDMMIALDVLPSGVDPRQKERLEFANQFGIFYVDT